MSDLHVFDSNGNAQYPEQGGTSTDIRNAWASKRYLVVDASDPSKDPTVVCYVNAQRPGEVRKQYYLVFQGSSSERLFEEFLDAVDRELGDWEFITGGEARQDVFAALRQDAESPYAQPSLVESCLDETTVRCETSSFEDAVGLIRSLDVSGRRFVVADDEDGIGNADLGIHRNSRLGSRIRFDDETAAQIEEWKTTRLREQALDGITEYADAVTTEEFLDTVSEEILNRKTPNHTVVEREVLQEETRDSVDPILTTREKILVSTFAGIVVGVIVGLYLWERLLAFAETTATLTIELLTSAAASIQEFMFTPADLLVVELPVWLFVIIGLTVFALIGVVLHLLGKGGGLTAGIRSNLPERIVSDETGVGTLSILEPTGGAAVTSPVTVRGQSEDSQVTITLRDGGTKIVQRKSSVMEGAFITQFSVNETGEYDIVVVDGSGKKELTVTITADGGDSWTVN